MKVYDYDDIMRSCLYDLEDVMDTREGSLAYITTSAFALMVAEIYSQLQLIEDNAYVTTAMGEYLDKTVALIGMERRGETKPVVKIVGAEGYGVGDKFAGGDYEYEVVQVYEDYYLAECSKEGEEGNSYLGEVLPLIDKTPGKEMSVTKIVVPGEKVEDDESLRARYLERMRCPVCMGNLTYYREAIGSFSGVGGIKVIPVAEGVGTVKVVITNSDNTVAEDELVSYVQECLDPKESSGQGFGIVPIGHKVKVESAQKVDVDILAETVPSANSEYFYRMGRSYIPMLFKEINKTWEKQDKIVLWDRTIEDYFISLGATDVNVISLNGQANRIVLKENQILGDVTINGA